MKYYRHKQKPDVVCEVIDGCARFGKWVWKDNRCFEQYSYKEVTEEFTNAFEEITLQQFDDVWGRKLQEA